MEIRPIRIEGDVAYVPLTKGYEALIDASDVHLVDGFNWHACVTPRVVYALRGVYPGGHKVAVYMHRVIMAAPSGMDVDHINCDGLDNRRINLRLATRSQNQRNQRLHKDNASGIKGVSFDENIGKWRARIKLYGKEYRLGAYLTKEDAAFARQAASAELHGEFARSA